ncbi:FbpB family small basic protein [Bacillus piscicola]|nr:FbpB family small basic protein [Bacillus piscicola]
MSRRRKISLKELLEENKKEILNNPASLDKIEEKWEEKKTLK